MWNFALKILSFNSNGNIVLPTVCIETLGLTPCIINFSFELNVVSGVNLHALIKETLAPVSIRNLKVLNFEQLDLISIKFKFSFDNKIFNSRTPLGMILFPSVGRSALRDDCSLN